MSWQRPHRRSPAESSPAAGSGLEARSSTSWCPCSAERADHDRWSVGCSRLDCSVHRPGEWPAGHRRPGSCTVGSIPSEGLVDKDVMSEPSKLAIFTTVVRRSGPHLIEATLIPAVLFYACLVAVGLGAAYVAVVGWACAALLRRFLRRDPVPPILVLSVVGITIRTLVAVVSN